MEQNNYGVGMLNIGENFIQDESIESFEFREYTPITSNLNGNVEIRFNINQQNVFLNISKSYLIFKGRLLKDDDSEFSINDNITLTNNALMHLFNDVKYSAGGKEIERLINPGETTTMLGCLKYDNNFETTIGLNQLWSKESQDFSRSGFEKRKSIILEKPKDKGNFSFCVPLKHIFGFCETYNKVMYGFAHELSLYRKENSDDSIIRKLDKTVSGDTVEYFKMSNEGKVKLDSLKWLVPHVKPSLEYQSKLLKAVKDKIKYRINYKKIQDIKTVVSSGTSFNWRLSTKTSPEKPRFIILGFQLENPRATDQFDKSLFIDANVRNIFVDLNSRRYPEVDYKLDFENYDYSRMFIEAIEFKEKCFMKDSPPNLSFIDYKEYYPLYVIDISNQEFSTKGQLTDITVNINFKNNVTKPLAIYAVIISDKIIQAESDGSDLIFIQ